MKDREFMTKVDMIEAPLGRKERMKGMYVPPH